MLPKALKKARDARQPSLIGLRDARQPTLIGLTLGHQLRLQLLTLPSFFFEPGLQHFTPMFQ